MTGQQIINTAVEQHKRHELSLFELDALKRTYGEDMPDMIIDVVDTGKTHEGH